MKRSKYFWVLTFLVCTSVYSQTRTQRISITDLRETQIEGVFELANKQKDLRTQLDCNSFIHAVNFYKKSNSNNSKEKWDYSHRFPVDASECFDIYSTVEYRLEQKLPICLELDFEDFLYAVSKKEESCR